LSCDYIATDEVKMRIINKKTREEFEVIGVASTGHVIMLPEVLVANVKTKEIKTIGIHEFKTNYLLK
jgi:hypothetical protein